MGSPANVKIEPMNVVWGVDTAQIATINCAADVTSSLNNKYFHIYEALNAEKFHVWFNVASAGTDPAPAGSTAIPVAISANATAAQVATAVASALDAKSEFISTASGAQVTCTNATAGYASAPHDGPSGSTSGFTFAVPTQGIAALDIGFIDSNIELSFPEDLVDITSHQTGTMVLGQIRTGFQPEITINFKETSVAQLKKVLTQIGSSMIPVGASATEVVGMGTSKLFSNTMSQATKLLMHPVALPSSDKSRDITAWKAYPMLESLNYSGEEILTIPVTFKLYQDTTKQPGQDYLSFGDSSQTLT